MHQHLSARSALGSTVLLLALTAGSTSPAFASPAPVAPATSLPAAPSTAPSPNSDVVAPAPTPTRSTTPAVPASQPAPRTPAPTTPAAPPAPPSEQVAPVTAPSATPVPTTAAPTTPVAAAPALPPADAALQPARPAGATPVTIVLPGTGERRTVLALPYSLDRDHDGVRESTALVMEPDLQVPTSSSVTLGVEQEWSSDSSTRAVPDPAEWDRIRARVAGIARAVADQPTRVALAQRAGLDATAGTPAEVDQLVLQAAQLAVWQLSSGVTVAPEVPYAGDARHAATLGALTSRLVQDASLTPSGAVDVYRIQAPTASAAPGAALRITGGRSIVAAGATAATPALVVARPTAAARPRIGQAAPAPAAKAPAQPRSASRPGTVTGPLAKAPVKAPSKDPAKAPSALTRIPAADTSSCTALGRTDVSRLDADYRPALDRDNDGIACESSGADGAVNLGGNRVATAPQTTNQVTVTPGGPTTSTSTSTTTTTQSCDELRAAGQSSIPAGSPLYRGDLDRDGDGVACEPYEGPRGSGALAQTGFEAPQLSALAFGTIGLGALLVRLGRRRARA